MTVLRSLGRLAVLAGALVIAIATPAGAASGASITIDAGQVPVTAEGFQAAAESLTAEVPPAESAMECAGYDAQDAWRFTLTGPTETPVTDGGRPVFGVAGTAAGPLFVELTATFTTSNGTTAIRKAAPDPRDLSSVILLTDPGWTLIAASAETMGTAVLTEDRITPSGTLQLVQTCPATLGEQARQPEQATAISPVQATTPAPTKAAPRPSATRTQTKAAQAAAPVAQAQPSKETVGFGAPRTGLPTTGMDIEGMVVLGAAMVVAGILVLTVRGRRHRSTLATLPNDKSTHTWS